ncbi:Hypothetical protein CINCED_3A023716 [Cinara cedri]|uniref:Uncharacterized protein n=1 Tax=Cinara cedri TaxID=506608 RepID=A0A5E4M458_9HEMI|nr:Hypothetical protein CINCED_3A023716 [Cinara cedri]
MFTISFYQLQRLFSFVEIRKATNAANATYLERKISTFKLTKSCRKCNLFGTKLDISTKHRQSNKLLTRN